MIDMSARQLNSRSLDSVDFPYHSKLDDLVKALNTRRKTQIIACKIIVAPSPPFLPEREIKRKSDESNLSIRKEY